jgi:hemerythrin
MALMTWTDKLSVGVAVLDDDHKKLVAMVNELYEAMQAGHGKEKLGRVLGDLVQYTKVHFAREETFFSRTGYAEAAAHKQQHAALTRQVVEVQEKYAAGQAATLSLEVMHFLRDWLVKHIQGSDQAYREHLNAKGIR